MRFKIVVCIYVFVAMFTYGYSFNNFSTTFKTFIGTEKHRSEEQIFVLATGCAIVWPLYWSVKLQEHAL